MSLGQKQVTRDLQVRVERVSIETNIGQQARINDGVSVVEGGEVKKRCRGMVGKRKVSRKPRKVPWTKEERKVFWECVIRAGGKGSEGYIPRMVKLWEERGISRRSQASLISQVNVIEKGGLSKMEREKIETSVRPFYMLACVGQAFEIDFQRSLS